MLTEASQFVFGAKFDPFYEDPSHMVIRGCIANATAFALQIVNYKVLLSIRVGHYLGVAVLVKGKFQPITQITHFESDVVHYLAGIAGLASSVAMLIIHGISNFGGDFVLQLLSATTNAIIGPCLVLLTANWYANTNRGCVVRLLFWASGYPVLYSIIDHITVAAGGGWDVYYAIYVGLAVICILLSFYIFTCVDMPGVAMWLNCAERKGRTRDRKSWGQNRRPLPVR